MAVAAQTSHALTSADLEVDVHDWLRQVTDTVEPEPIPKQVIRVRDPRASRSATKTVVGMIVTNIAFQVGLLLTASAHHWPPDVALKTSLFGAAFFYAILACIVSIQADTLALRPVWLIGPARRAIGYGFVVGGALAVALTAVMTLASGRPAVDETAALIAGNQSLALLLVGFFVLAVAAPFAEEYLFRGFMAESLRSKGRFGALLLSGIAFSLAHLRFAQFRYYLLMGMGLGALYWSRGLLASISAHATFNGLLAILAVASVHGPTQQLTASNVSVSLPATWHRVASTGGADLTALGPSSAQIIINHIDLPAGAVISAEAMADALKSGRVPMPGGSQLDTTSVRTTSLPVGPAVRAHATTRGRADDAVLTIVGRRLVVFEIVPNGSTQAARDFERMLATAKLASPTL